MKKNKKKKKSQVLANFIYKLCIFIIVLLIIGIVFSQTTIAKINIEVQELSKKQKQQQNINESLSIKIDEMTSLDRIQKVCEEYGLSYNSENIKTIE